MRPNRASFRGVLGAAGLCVALALTGCAGARFRAPADPLLLLGDQAALYASIPVAPNRILLSKAAESLKGLGEKDRDSLSGLLDRTERVWVSLSADRSVNAVLTGDFPRAAAAFVFPESKGWKRVKGPSSLSWYVKGAVSAAIPVSGLACVTLGSDMGEMLRRAEAPAYPPVSEAMASLSASKGVSDITLSVADPLSVLPLVLGSDITLPVERLDGIGRPIDGGSSYAVDLAFTAPDASRARALATLLRLISGTSPETEANRVTIKTEGTSAETLAGFASFLLF